MLSAIPATPRTRRLLFLDLRVAVTAGIIGYVVIEFVGAALLQRLLATDPPTFAAAVLLIGLQVLLTSARWRLVMRCFDLAIGSLPALRIFAISVWFSQVLPSLVGGDAVRVWLLRRAGIGWRPGGKAVLVDRILALFAVLMLIAVTYPLFWPIAGQDAARATVALLLAAGLGGLLLLVSLDLLPPALRRIWLVARLVSLAQGTRLVLFGGRRSAGLVLFSAAIHGLTVAAVFALARGAEAALTPLQALALVPPVILLAAVPISIGSWGVREGAMVASLGLAGVEAATALAVSIQLGLASVVVGLLGGAVWLFGGDRAAYARAQAGD